VDSLLRRRERLARSRGCWLGMMGYMGFKVKNIVDFTSTGGEVDIGDSIPKLGSVRLEFKRMYDCT